MTKVKVCGITSVEDAKKALDLGADAIGLVFAKSPRHVSVDQAAKITKAVGPWMATVGVFVNEPAERVIRTVIECGLTCAQLHGDENSLYTRKLSSFKVIKAFRVGESFDFKKTLDFGVDAFLFDTKVEGLFGGSGKSFNWKLLSGKKVNKPFILAGGLNPKNVRQSIRLAKPYGVDVSGGVESSPGKKDAKLIKEFIKNAKTV